MMKMFVHKFAVGLGLWWLAAGILLSEVVSQQEEMVVVERSGVLPLREERSQVSYFRDGKPIFAVVTTRVIPGVERIKPVTSKKLVFFPAEGSEVEVALPLGWGVKVRSWVPIYLDVGGDLVGVVSQDGTFCEYVLMEKEGGVRIVSDDFRPRVKEILDGGRNRSTLCPN